MALDTFITLDTLRCIEEADPFPGFGSEPYIWPVLVRIDDFTLQTDAHVQVVSPLSSNARVVIKNDMRAGETVAIPQSVGMLRVRLEANVFVTRLILIVALWDQEESPNDAVTAGFRAFVREVGAALGDLGTLLVLKNAEETNDEEAEKETIKAIEDQIRGGVESAIRGALSGPQKVAVATGFLSLDDAIGSAFKGFSNAISTKFALPVGKRPNEFEIQGRLETREVRVDRCQVQANRVRDAQAVVDEVRELIKRKQDDLKQASPSEKPFIIEEIAQLKEEDLVFALEALGRARTALSICRSRTPFELPTEAEQG